MREDTWQKVIESRRFLEYVLKTIKPPLWFYGHYHHHYEGSIGETTYQGLDIAEMAEVD